MPSKSRPVTTSKPIQHRQRVKRSPRITLTDEIVGWTLFTIIIALMLYSMCALVWVVS